MINFPTFSQVSISSVETLQCTLIQIIEILSITRRIFHEFPFIQYLKKLKR